MNTEAKHHTETPTNPEEERKMETEKKPYAKPELKPLGSVKDLTATGSGDPRFCPNGKPKPPSGNCGH